MKTKPFSFEFWRKRKVTYFLISSFIAAVITVIISELLMYEDSNWTWIHLLGRFSIFWIAMFVVGFSTPKFTASKRKHKLEDERLGGL